MGQLGRHITCHLVMACSLSAVLISTTAQAAGNGEIVVIRKVQPFAVGNPAPRPDPNPTTVNTNPSAQINSVTQSSELGDGDFARVSTGAGVTRAITANTNPLPGLNTSNGMPGLTNGRAGGSSGGVANNIGGQINRSIEQGMRPLTSFGKGQ